MEGPMMDHDSWLADTLVDVVDTLVRDFDVVDVLGELSRRCAELLDGAEAGVLLDDGTGTLQVASSSSERHVAVELLEAQRHEGPALDAFHAAGRIVDQRLDEVAAARWPRFVARAHDAGVATVHALPLCWRGEVVGALSVCDTRVRPVAARELAALESLASAVALALVQERSVRRAGELSVQLRSVLQCRAVVDQATGILAERLGVGVEVAYEELRHRACDEGGQLVTAAAAVVLEQDRRASDGHGGGAGR